MKYWVWANEYRKFGIVKADNISEAKHKVEMSQGEYTSVNLLEDSDFDGYDVTTLIE